MGVIVILSLFAAYVQQSNLMKDDWKAVANDLAKDSRSDYKSHIYIMISYEMLPFTYYYVPKCFSSEVYYCDGNNGVHPIDSYAQIEHVSDEHVILILSRMQYGNFSAILDYFEKNYELGNACNYTLYQGTTKTGIDYVAAPNQSTGSNRYHPRGLCY